MNRGGNREGTGLYVGHSRAEALPGSLLGPDDPDPVGSLRPDGRSPFFLTCEHAGRVFPRSLGTLGVAAPDLERHIAWDIGAAQVSKRLSALLDAHLVTQTYSRLVVDCNRSSEHADFIPQISELTEIPGNRNLAADAAALRTREIYLPFHRAVASALDERTRQGRASVLVAVHSFTPVFKGKARPWHVGLLFNRDDRLGRLMAEEIAPRSDLCLGINEPYAISDATDFTIPYHGEKRGIPHVEIEIRQDLIAAEAGQHEWADMLAQWLTRCLDRLPAAPSHTRESQEDRE